MDIEQEEKDKNDPTIQEQDRKALGKEETTNPGDSKVHTHPHLTEHPR
jgi:hypothetical protein